MNPEGYEGYDGGSILKMNGFRKHSSVESVQKFHSHWSVATENIDKMWTESEIKQKLATNLMLQLQEKGYIDFFADRRSYSHTVRYTSQISVVKFHDLEHVYAEKYGYFLEDKEFSLKEIETAIKNTYPERFLI